MKKLLTGALMVVLGLLINMNTTYAQGNLGLKAGVNLANINGVNFSTEARVGFMFGVYYLYWLNTRFVLQPELLYSVKGWKQGEDTFNLNYLIIDVLLAYYFATSPKIMPFLKAGPYLGFNTSAKVSYDGGEIKLTDVKGTDFGIVAEAGAAYRQFQFGLRLALGLTSIFDESYEDGVGTGGPDYEEESTTPRNFVFGFFVGYSF